MKDISIGSIVYFINEQGDKCYLSIGEVFVSSYTSYSRQYMRGYIQTSRGMSYVSVYTDIYSIPLTPQLFLEHGFSQEGDTFLYNEEPFKIIKNNDEWILQIFKSDKCICTASVQYLDQVQSLFRIYGISFTFKIGLIYLLK